jgi:hypothetical protein
VAGNVVDSHSVEYEVILVKRSGVRGRFVGAAILNNACQEAALGGGYGSEKNTHGCEQTRRENKPFLLPPKVLRQLRIKESIKGLFGKNHFTLIVACKRQYLDAGSPLYARDMFQ